MATITAVSTEKPCVSNTDHLSKDQIENMVTQNKTNKQHMTRNGVQHVTDVNSIQNASLSWV